MDFGSWEEFSQAMADTHREDISDFIRKEREEFDRYVKLVEFRVVEEPKQLSDGK